MTKDDFLPNPNTNILSKIKDLEENQLLLKNRLLLIGKNLLDLREKYDKSMIDSKKEIEELKELTKKLNNYIQSISHELPKYSKTEDLELLSKQAKMFQPLEFIRKSEIEEIIESHNKSKKKVPNKKKKR